MVPKTPRPCIPCRAMDPTWWDAGTRAKARHKINFLARATTTSTHSQTRATYLGLTPFSFANFCKTAVGERPSTSIQWRQGSSKAGQSTLVIGAKANDMVARGEEATSQRTWPK